MTHLKHSRQITRPGSGKYYVIDGKEYPRITSILSVISKPVLMNWAVSLERKHAAQISRELYQELQPLPPLSDEAYSKTFQSRIGPPAHKTANKKAIGIGLETHALIEAKNRIKYGDPGITEPVVSDDAVWAAMSFEDWATMAKVEPVAVEETVWSDRHLYAGTMDLLATIDGKRLVIDFKTGKRIYGSEAFLQNAAYQQALIEMGHGPIDGGLIVRLPKVQSDPDFEVAKVPPLETCWPVVEATLTLWRWATSHA